MLQDVDIASDQPPSTNRSAESGSDTESEPEIETICTSIEEVQA